MSVRDNGGVSVDYFRVGDKVYEHLIFCSEDDRIELHTVPNDKPLLKFDSSCGVWTPDGKKYGRLRMWNGNEWEFIFAADERAFEHTHRDLLKLEVEVSKHYLKTIAKETP